MDKDKLTALLVRLAAVVMDFGQVQRITKHPDGSRETDTTHTVMLGMVACCLADKFAPTLDRGRIAQLALVHDLVEVYAGDTPTLRMLSAQEARSKAYLEQEAEHRLLEEFDGLPWLTAWLQAYRDQALPEARWVRAVDKILPKLTHLLNGAVVVHDEGMTAEELAQRYTWQRKELAYARAWPKLLDLHAELADQVLRVLALSGCDAND